MGEGGPVPIPGEWNAPSVAATVWGSSSRLVQVTEVPALTVNAAGTNAKPSMATWSPLTGAAGAVTDMDIIGMVSCAPAAGLEAEHPVTTSPRSPPRPNVC